MKSSGRGCLVYLYSGLTHLSRCSAVSSLGECPEWAPGVAAYLLLSYVRCTVLLITAPSGSWVRFGIRAPIVVVSCRFRLRAFTESVQVSSQS